MKCEDEQVDCRLRHLPPSEQKRHAEMNARFDRLDARMDREFNIAYILAVGMWVTILGAIIVTALLG